jgi:phospholipase C
MFVNSFGSRVSLCGLVLSIIFTFGCRGPQDAFRPMPTVSLTTSASTIDSGQSVTLTVSASNATSVTIDNGVGAVTPGASVTVTPTQTTTYTATATNINGSATSAATVTVNTVALLATLSANPTSIIVGSPTTLTWTSSGASTVTIDGGVGSVNASGSTTVSPGQTTTYTLTATAADGRTTSATASVNVLPPGSAILTLTVSPAQITSGQTATLSWTSQNISYIRIDSGTGPFGGKNGLGVFTQPSGSVTVSPNKLTTFNAQGFGPDGKTQIATATATLAATKDTTKLKANVNHIVYFLQENRSFDMHFGKMNAYRASLGLSQDVDGLPDGVTQLRHDGTAISTFHIRTACIENVSPDWLQSHGDYNLSDPSSDVPKIDGFVHNGSGMAKSSGRVAADTVGGTGMIENLTPNSTTVYYLFQTDATGLPSTKLPLAAVSVIVNVPPPGVTLPAQPSTHFTPDPSVTFTATSTSTTTGTTVGPASQITITKGDTVTLNWTAPNVLATDKTYVNTWFDQIGRRTMGWFDGNDLPYHYFMASQFAMSDRFFSPLPGNSPPNRAYAYSATTNGLAHDPGTMTVKSIFHLLQDAGVSWKVYYSSVDDAGEPRSVMTRFPDLMANHRDKLVPVDPQYFNDVANNQLPAVAFIEEKSGLDEHPGATLRNGVHNGNHVQRGVAYAADLINRLMNSPSWGDSVFILTYDEYGGLYDHVAPPDAVAPDAKGMPTDLEPQDAPTQKNQDQGFTRAGWRVPMYVVSPFAKKNYVSHTTADFTAILRFIETRYDLPSLTARDAAQIDMLEFFDFDAKPWATPPSPPTQPVNMQCDYSDLQ